MAERYLCIDKKIPEEEQIVGELGRFNGKANINDVEKEFVNVLKYKPNIYSRKQFEEAKKTNSYGLPNLIFYPIAKDDTLSLLEHISVKDGGEVSVQGV